MVTDALPACTFPPAPACATISMSLNDRASTKASAVSSVVSQDDGCISCMSAPSMTGRHARLSVTVNVVAASGSESGNGTLLMKLPRWCQRGSRASMSLRTFEAYPRQRTTMFPKAEERIDQIDESLPVFGRPFQHAFDGTHDTRNERHHVIIREIDSVGGDDAILNGWHRDAGLVGRARHGKVKHATLLHARTSRRRSLGTGHAIFHDAVVPATNDATDDGIEASANVLPLRIELGDGCGGVDQGIQEHGRGDSELIFHGVRELGGYGIGHVVHSLGY